MHDKDEDRRCEANQAKYACTREVHGESWAHVTLCHVRHAVLLYSLLCHAASSGEPVSEG